MLSTLRSTFLNLSNVAPSSVSYSSISLYGFNSAAFSKTPP